MTDPSKNPGCTAVKYPGDGEQSEKAKRMIASYSMCDPIPDIDVNGYEVVPHQAFRKQRAERGSERHG